MDIPQPLGKTAVSVEEALRLQMKSAIQYLVRPSYVLGGRAMEIVYNEEEITTLYGACSRMRVQKIQY